MAPVLPFVFNAPIFSALSDKDDKVVAVGESRLLTVVDRIPDIMPPMFTFQAMIGVPESNKFMIKYEDERTYALQDNGVYAGFDALQVWVLEYVESKNAYIIYKDTNEPPRMVWNVNGSNDIFLKQNDGLPPPGSQLFRITPPQPE